MAQQVVYTPKKNDDYIQRALPIVGGVVGAVYGGGPAGAAAGAGAGQAASGILANQENAKPPELVQQDPPNPMARRVESDQRLQDLINAKSAVAQLPQDQQQQYAPAIDQAYAMERQRRGLA